MTAREPSDGHSDLGPSSKDWLPGSAGRDEDFTPDKDRWTAAHKGNLGAGRPGEDVGSGRQEPFAGASSRRDVQPGTQSPGRSWQSREPDPTDEDDKLDQALKDTFPTSDPPQAAQPGITGWDLDDDQWSRGGGEWGRGGRRDHDTRSRLPDTSFRTMSPERVWGAALIAFPAVLAVAWALSRSRQSRRARDEWRDGRRN